MSVMKPLLASIMMPAYNAEAYISDAIESVLNQTYSRWELCIVDDGSTDRTYDVARSFTHPNIKVERIEHSGCPTARNKCLEMMSGDIYFKQDADDIQDPTRVEKQINLFLNDDKLDIVTCCYSWLRNGRIEPRRSSGIDVKLLMDGKGGYPCNASISAWNYVYTRVGGYKAKQLAGSDGDWIFRAILAGFKWGHVAEHLYVQRRHKQQISQAMRQKQREVHEQARRYYRELWKEMNDERS